jgi:hypothetical protein
MHHFDFNNESKAAENIWYWANAYKASIALFALLEVGVLEQLAVRQLSSIDLASMLKLPHNILEPILNLLVAIGVLDVDHGNFVLSSAVVKMLPLLSLEKILSIKYIQSNKLVHMMQGGEALDPMKEDDVQNLLPVYLAAMAVSARSLAPHLVLFARFSSYSRILDLGGADGTLALALARLIPYLTVTVVDRPLIESAFWTQVRNEGREECFRFVAGDIRNPKDIRQELANADVTIISNVLHLLSVQERLELLRIICNCMYPGACLLIYDQFISSHNKLDATRFMTIDWLLGGYNFEYSEQNFVCQLEELGFTSVLHRRITTLPGAMIVARIPEKNLRRDL